MKIFLALLSAGLALVAQGLVDGLLPFSVAVALSFGLVVYFLYDKKVGWLVIYGQALIVDLMYSISLPINLLTVLLVHCLWWSLVAGRLTLSTAGAKLFGLSFWLTSYFILHWCLAWGPYWLGDQIMHPQWFYLLSYFLNFVMTYFIALMIFGLGYWLVNKFSYNKMNVAR